MMYGIVALLFAIQSFAQNRRLQMHAVAFYNLENLFDTCHDEGKNDWEFLPDGTYHWTKVKYEHKLANMARVLTELATDKLPYGASIIGVSEVENSKLVTACAVRCEENDVIYKFYVSVPKGQSETESGSGISYGKKYEFKADNFSDALEKFRHSVSGKIDLGHVSLFVGEKAYMDQKFRNDYKFIREEIKTTPAMHYCLTMSEEDTIFDCISSECEGNPATFAENMFQNRNNYLGCTATELHFACENKYYTASVPVIEISGDKSDPVAIHTGAYFYSQMSGTFHVYGNDFEIYKLCRKKIYNSEKSL